MSTDLCLTHATASVNNIILVEKEFFNLHQPAFLQKMSLVYLSSNGKWEYVNYFTCLADTGEVDPLIYRVNRPKPFMLQH